MPFHMCSIVFFDIDKTMIQEVPLVNYFTSRISKQVYDWYVASGIPGRHPPIGHKMHYIWSTCPHM
jgi:hypothetical protein